MPKIAGRNADFAISLSTAGEPNLPTVATDAAYAYTDADFSRIETVSNEITLNIESRTEETTGYGDSFDTFDVLTYKWTVSIVAYYVDAIYAGSGSSSGEATELTFFNGLLGQLKRKFVFSPAGKPAGDADATHPKYLGRVVIANVSVVPARAGISKINVTLNGDGPLFRDIA